MTTPNRCPKCGQLHLDPPNTRRCYYDEFMEALAGVELTHEEQRYLRWLSGWDDETMRVFKGLFTRLVTAQKGER